MNAELNSLSSGPLFYFLLHSGTFVFFLATIFFILGLVFGWLTWSRHRRAVRRLTGELEGKKDEIALLKRTLAEHNSRLPTESDDAGANRDSGRYFDNPDLVLGSFLATASSLLPDLQPNEASPASIADEVKPVENRPTASSSSGGARAPAITIRPSTHPLQKPQPIAEIETPSSSSAPNNILKSLIVGAVHSAVTGQNEKGSASPEIEQPSASVSDNESKPQEATDSSSEVIRLVSDPHLGLVFRARPPSIDDLSQLKGVASGIESRLNELGVYTFKQIALWSDENIIEFSRLLSFKDRIRREQWVDQARELHYHTYNERV